MTTKTVPAYSLVGAEGRFRVPGGRATYESVIYNDETARGDRIRLTRLEVTPDGLHQVNRWVDWEAPVEILDLQEGWWEPYTYHGRCLHCGDQWTENEPILICPECGSLDVTPDEETS